MQGYRQQGQGVLLADLAQYFKENPEPTGGNTRRKPTLVKNWNLWNVVTSGAQTLTFSDLCLLFDIPKALNSFDAISWKLLSLLCDRCSPEAILTNALYTVIENWAAEALVEEERAAAHLFLQEKRTASTGLENVFDVTALLKDTEFYLNFGTHYLVQNAIFKNLPAVRSVLQLRQFFNLNAGITDLNETITTLSFIHEKDVFLHHLLNTHSNEILRLSQILLRLNTIEDNPIYLSSKLLYERLCLMTPDHERTIYTHPALAIFCLLQTLLEYQTLILRVASKTQLNTQILQFKKAVASENQGRLTKEEHKIAFLRSIIRHLIDHPMLFDREPFPTSFQRLHEKFKPQAPIFQEAISFGTVRKSTPIIWEIYVDAYLVLQKHGHDRSCLTTEECRYAPEKISAVNDWLKHIILYGEKTKNALAKLPAYVLTAIFLDSSVNVPALIDHDRKSYYSTDQTLWSSRAVAKSASSVASHFSAETPAVV